ncbi:MAG: hypothetical protein JWM27_71 [Gemmatimonadetes bacterium]|nr:hypothetical protein [Gemmatimonadota bacterium]
MTARAGTPAAADALPRAAREAVAEMRAMIEPVCFLARIDGREEGCDVFDGSIAQSAAPWFAHLQDELDRFVDACAGREREEPYPDGPFAVDMIRTFRNRVAGLAALAEAIREPSITEHLCHAREPQREGSPLVEPFSQSVAAAVREVFESFPRWAAMLIGVRAGGAS